MVQVSVTNEFELFYRRYFDRIYQYVHRRIRNAQTAEDIVQETFCAAYMKRHILQEHSQPQLWLLRTAKNKMLELHRSMRYRITVPLEEKKDLGQEELRYRIKELEVTALATLGTEEWKLVKDYYLYGFTVSELAEEKGITENNMRVKLCRLRKKLREE